VHVCVCVYVCVCACVRDPGAAYVHTCMCGVCVCLCVCVYVCATQVLCMYIHAYGMHTCQAAYVHVHVHVCVCVCVRVRVCSTAMRSQAADQVLCMYMHEHTCIHDTYVSVCNVCVRACVRACGCLYVLDVALLLLYTHIYSMYATIYPYMYVCMPQYVCMCLALPCYYNISIYVRIYATIYPYMYVHVYDMYMYHIYMSYPCRCSTCWMRMVTANVKYVCAYACRMSNIFENIRVGYQICMHTYT
jgi:hypothetical protein